MRMRQRKTYMQQFRILFRAIGDVLCTQRMRAGKNQRRREAAMRQLQGHIRTQP